MPGTPRKQRNRRRRWTLLVLLIVLGLHTYFVAQPWTRPDGLLWALFGRSGPHYPNVLVRAGESVEILTYADGAAYDAAWEARTWEPGDWFEVGFIHVPFRSGVWAHTTSTWNATFFSHAQLLSLTPGQQQDAYEALGRILNSDQDIGRYIHPRLVAMYDNAKGPTRVVEHHWLGYFNNLIALTLVIWIGSIAVQLINSIGPIRRVDSARCPHCNYNLQGLNSDSPCPECGNDRTSGDGT